MTIKITILVACGLLGMWLLSWAHHEIPKDAWYHAPTECTICVVLCGLVALAFFGSCDYDDPPHVGGD